MNRFGKFVCLSLCMLALLQTQNLKAQTCQPNCVAQADVFLDSLCEATVSIVSLLTPTNSCNSNFVLTLVNGHGDTLPNGLVSGQLPGATLSATVTEMQGGLSCSTSIVVRDTILPFITCKNPFTVLLNSGGTAMRFAQTFESTSGDACSSILLQARRLGTTLWANTVVFNCADTDIPVQVEVRALQLSDTALFAKCTTTVTARDQWFPWFTTCPANLTVNCDYDYTNTTYTGWASAEDNCSLDTIVHSIDNQVGMCGTGSYINRWIAIDHKNQADTCLQVITVTNSNPYHVSMITWPTDYTLHQCGAAASHPDSLPAPHNRPVLQQAFCSLPGTSWADETITYGTGGCYTIIRTWTVSDWCQMDPNNPAAGRWTKKQFIHVQDNIAPMLVVPADITVTTNSNCTTGAVNLAQAIATDNCSNVTITNNSPYSTAQGANASGVYPKGVTLIAFRAQDECGNLMQKEVKITVKDLTAPTAICKNGLSINLTANGNGYGAEVPVELFNQASYDHCTPKADLKMGIKITGSSAAPSPTLSFDCSNKGQNLIELWVTDAAGNSGYCQTYILVQDNGNFCGTSPTTSLRIAGAVETRNHERVEAVEVILESINPAVATTPKDGCFTFEHLPLNQDYRLMPSRDTGWLNGVNMLDVLKLQRYILGIEPFTSPYQFFAADVNGSKTITSADIVELRKLILGAYAYLPYAKSWQFFDKQTSFNAANPLASAWSNEILYSGLSCDTTATFVGVKTGDIDDSAVASGQSSDDRNNATLAMNQTVKQQSDGLVRFDIFPKVVIDLTAMQMALEVQNGEVISVLQGALDVQPEQVYYSAFGKSGTTKIAWHTKSDAMATPDRPLFSILVKPTDAAQVTSLTLAATEMPAMAFDATLASLQLNLETEERTVQIADNQAFVSPNPMGQSAILHCNIGQAQAGILQIISSDGRAIRNEKMEFAEGEQKIRLDGVGLAAGVYQWKLVLADAQMNGFFVKI